MKRVLASLSVALIAVSPLAFVRAHSAAAGSAYTFENACGAVAPGYMRCNAVLRITNLDLDVTHPSGYNPPDLQSAYNLPSTSAGSGQTVAVVDAFDNPRAEHDLGVYRKQFGLPPCTTANGCFKKVNQTGGKTYPPPDPSGGWEAEESLDVDMVSAICPNCHILLVEATDNLTTNLAKAVDEAAKLGANAISNSYGSPPPESKSELNFDPYYNHPGIAVTASAGDTGYGVEYPAASPYVTAVGGTSLHRTPGTTRGWTETVWGNQVPGQGTGSGCSKYEPKPSWQHDRLCANRTVGDVAAVADPATGVSIYDTFPYPGAIPGWLVVGGTSVASPIIASIYALAGNASSVVYGSYGYSHTGSLYDVTSGSNGSCGGTYLCTGEPGYDGPTGNGTPNGTGAF